ncbi:Tigger transposable element-derived protein 4 [Araneus ventricosus]|uniref:Tigger transposable element-derived protein 4 n=1 Tax=Araneus ventricosus TaxID=182803 RepID=A0A4Y2I1F3_ARAVE|nr:Tigger transposable element-derived protein 4 [Araneus ventricosus]
MEKAQGISKKLNVECDASFSSGWLYKFKLRHGITGKTVSGESGDVDCETMDDWIQNQLPDLIKGYEQKDIFNADETGLFYNLQPSKTLAIKSDTCHGGSGKKNKVPLTVILCANADGSEKLLPLIIGKSKKPRCFKNVKTLPTKYLSNKKSWMTMSFFTDWLKGLDDKMRKQKSRIILFIDQCPAHPPDTDFLKNITVKFFLQIAATGYRSLDHGNSKNMKIDVFCECLDIVNPIHHRGRGWPSGKISASGPEGPRPQTRLLRRSAVYVGPLHVKSYVGIKRKFGEGVPAQVSSSSSDQGSKL